MALTAEQLAALTVLVDQYAAASEQLQQSAASTAQVAWLTFAAWYAPTPVTALATALADLSREVQQAAAGLASQYVATAVDVIEPGTPIRFPRSLVQPVRKGAPLSLVHSRPAETYKRAIATGATHEEALQRAGTRAAGLTISDLTLQQRAVERRMLEQAGVTGYRRIVRPELSKTGSCGLCIAAADRIYSTGELMPIHPPSCNCTVLPIIGENDPGRSMNDAELKALYADAGGSTKAEDLRRTRYKVREHGEFGPVLVRAEDSFRGPSKVALEDDPERAERMLAKVLPVLADLEQRQSNGEDVSQPLAYQRDLIERLTSIVGAAA